MSPGQAPCERGVPTAAEADALAQRLLGAEGTRLAHVRTAGFLAGLLAPLFEPAEGALLVAAATMHDIGYSTHVVRTGFHPLDGGLYLRDAGYPERLAALIAHHSHAHLMASAQGVDLSAYFPQERSLLVDALVYADMHSAPDGRIIPAEARLADIAARRPSAVESARGEVLRAAMARVGAALLAGLGPAADADPPKGSRFRRWWIEEARRSAAAGSRGPT